MCHRGYVLTSSLYFVTQAHLSAAQLVLLGTGMAVTLTVSDIPAGVWSDAFSRKWPLVLGHGFLAAGMLLTGLVTAFPLLLLSQVLWALGWACSGGADVAWLTDELGQPDRIGRLLTARARWDLTGGMAGMLAFGMLGWAAGLTAAIVASGWCSGTPGSASRPRPPAWSRCASWRRGSTGCARPRPATPWPASSAWPPAGTGRSARRAAWLPGRAAG